MKSRLLLSTTGRTPQLRFLEVRRLNSCRAINNAVDEYATGDALLICIDGARMFSPCLVRRTIDTLDTFPGAMTFVGSRHLGPKVQSKSAQEGYNQVEEDALLNSVNWMEDLDMLFSISVWAGAHARGSSLALNESNAFGMTRETWMRYGGYREEFTRPGGGLANLEIFSRYLKRPSCLNVLLWGEATFHQFHGGAATSDVAYFRQSLDEYERVVGEPYERPPLNFLLGFGDAYKRMDRVGQYLKL